jgi:hypothetical protein
VSSVLSVVAARAERWLLEPAPAPAQRAVAPAPVVAVVGLARGSGASTIARAVAVELARRHVTATAVVSADSLPAAGLAMGAARRVARGMGEDARPLGRLVLVTAGEVVRGAAAGGELPVVFDVSHGVPPEAALALADRALLVASPDVEPALAQVAGEALARDGLPPLLVLNRAAEDAEHWGDLPDVSVGEGRLGARLALAGRDPVGALRAAAAVLADACEGVVAHG